MALNKSRTEFPLYVLNRRKSEMYMKKHKLLSVQTAQLHGTVWDVCLPVCRGTEMCILQLVRTTDLPAVSSLTTIGLSAGSFSMRSLTSCTTNTHLQKQCFYCQVHTDSRLSKKETGSSTPPRFIPKPVVVKRYLSEAPQQIKSSF